MFHFINLSSIKIYLMSEAQSNVACSGHVNSWAKLFCDENAQNRPASASSIQGAGGVQILFLHTMESKEILRS